MNSNFLVKNQTKVYTVTLHTCRLLLVVIFALAQELASLLSRMDALKTALASLSF